MNKLIFLILSLLIITFIPKPNGSYKLSSDAYHKQQKEKPSVASVGLIRDVKAVETSTLETKTTSIKDERDIRSTYIAPPTQTPKNDENVKAIILPSQEEIAQKIRKVFGPDAEVAIAIARAESGLRPNAVGDTSLTFYQDGVLMGMSCGVFQIRVLRGRPSCEELQNPDANIQWAYNMYKSQGFNPWSVYHNNRYQQFLVSK